MSNAVCERQVEIIRPNSYGFCGGNWGDEGKAKVIDQIDGEVFYRDNGGSNAGHTIELEDGRKIVLHHLPSGVGREKATVILAKGMVIHPKELVYEIDEARDFFGGKIARIKIDEEASLCLDTHRAYEGALKKRANGSKGSTGRGIGPAYVDELNRNELKMKDLLNFNEEKIRKHYRFYKDQINGLGFNIDNMEVPFLDFKETFVVGSEDEFVDSLRKQAEILKPYIEDVHNFVEASWKNKNVMMIFEKAQAIGLDRRWGVNPDVTASNTCFDGIYASSDGIINPREIQCRIAVDKGPYASSVGSRILPSMMDPVTAKLYRDYGHEFGATTGRPRDMVYKDLVSFGFYIRVGNINGIAMTHMDSVFEGIPVKICTEYQIDGQKVDYRPSQDFLSRVTPVYTELATWNREKVQKAKCFDDMPQEAKDFVKLVEDNTGTKVMYLTNGPRRDQVIRI